MNTSAAPKWYFPPRNGGIDFVHDPSAAFFNDNPIPKLVREVIQNSLDAREPGIAEPVLVTFTDARIKRNLLGAAQLYRHLTACVDRAVYEGRTDIQELYERAVNTLKDSHIRCLRITDGNTTGLTGSRWDALVAQEGSVQKADTGAPGGAFGIGKNAVFNVSDIQTVFYSTHYIDIRNRKGRVDKLQGKATLMSHTNPQNGEEALQHIGFYQDADGQPIIGMRRIDPFFRLNEPGTGVFIMGFNPRTDDWVGEIVRAVLQNFFYAIHHQRLVVRIEDGNNAVEIKRDDLESLFEMHHKDISDSHFYYRAIRDAELETTKPIRNLGEFDVFIHLNGGPKRMAFVNRNGMLVSDSREQKANPIYTRNRSLWPDYAAVILPSTDSVDKLIRKMENPSHDAISVAKLRERNEQVKMENAFKNARDAIREMMDSKTHLDQSGHQANLRELAEMFPELDPKSSGVTSLNTQVISQNVARNQDSFVESDNDSDDNEDTESIDPNSGGDSDGTEGDGTEGGDGGGNGEGGSNGSDNGGGGGNRGAIKGEGTYRIRRRNSPVKGVRVLTTGERTVLVCFTPIGISPHEVKFSLKAAGEEHLNVERIGIASASLQHEKRPGEKVSVSGDIISLSIPETERMVVEVETSDSVANVAFKLGVLR